jgi:cell division protein FtsI (penicillin-binding protein 3)
MIRTPLRPLARILRARDVGENPDAIERENLRLRLEEMRDRQRQRAESRLLVLAVFFICAYGVVAAQMGLLALSSPEEPRVRASAAQILSDRADILDRNGRLLATNLDTHALYVQTRELVEPARAARELARIFPDLEAEALLRRFTDGRKFLWVKPQLSPEQMQAVHEIGEPGLLFASREMRLYPNGRLASHVLGGARFGEQSVHSAELLGVAGVEKAFDGWLKDPGNDGKPLVLSIDMTVQSAVEEILYGGMKMMNAKGAAAVLMDVHTGEIVAMASLPDFDPNDRPAAAALAAKAEAGESPLFNRAVQGVYELGSTFKIFTAAQAMQLGQVNAETLIEANGTMRVGRHTIREFQGKNYGPKLSVTDVIVKSSNVGTGQLALQIGAERQQDFLRELGFFEPTRVELVEAPTGRPLLPPRWSDIVTVTASYGHGMSASPLHLATAYASLLNGGTRVEPTLLRRGRVQPGPRVVREEVSRASAKMLRAVVERGTASFGEVPGYNVAGKTGTADKPNPRGGYYDDKVIATFASVFPADDPKYTLIVTLDEPVETSGSKPYRTAGWTAVPVAAEIIRRTAPLLGLKPQIAPVAPTGVTLTANN